MGDNTLQNKTKIHELIATLTPKINQAFEISGTEESIISAAEASLSAIPKGKEIAGTIDHTLLKAQAVPAQVDVLCQEAIQYGFAAVCVNARYVAQAAGLLKNHPVKVAAVVGFPLGATLSAVKAEETRLAIADGATEIDMVLPIGEMAAGNYAHVAADILAVSRVAHAEGAFVKVILETALLDFEQKVAACMISTAAGADFVKTSTGFSTAGATTDDIAMMRQIVGKKAGVKAAGGVRSFEDAKMMLSHGANRLGASSGVAIVQGALGQLPGGISSNQGY